MATISELTQICGEFILNFVYLGFRMVPKISIKYIFDHFCVLELNL